MFDVPQLVALMSATRNRWAPLPLRSHLVSPRHTCVALWLVCMLPLLIAAFYGHM